MSKTEIKIEDLTAEQPSEKEEGYDQWFHQKVEDAIAHNKKHPGDFKTLDALREEYKLDAYQNSSSS